MGDNFKANRKDLIKTFTMLVGILGAMVLNTGCAQVLVPGTLAGAGELYRYSTGNVAQQTLLGSLDQVVSYDITCRKIYLGHILWMDPPNTFPHVLDLGFMDNKCSVFRHTFSIIDWIIG
jgi:hypothetical protein